jgi:hypothetical protein
LKAALGSFLADSLRWSDRPLPHASQVVVAMLGIAVPIAAGAATGHLRLGMTTALGGLALGGGDSRATPRGAVASLAASVAAGCAAVYAGVAIAGHGAWTDAAVVGLASVTGLAGSISRPMARAAMRFILFVIIATSLAAAGASPVRAMLGFAAGAIWTAALTLLWQTVACPTAPAAPRGPTVKARLRRWRATLHTLAGWQYALRLTLCLGIAEAIGEVWPQGHIYWIALTVAIVLRRDVPAALTRTFQRAVGTVAGIFAGSLILLCEPPLWGLLGTVALLAAVRPILQAGNYMAYAAVMTPLIVLLTELDRAPAASLLVDRFAATMAGCAIAVVFGYLIWPRQATAATGT